MVYIVVTDSQITWVLFPHTFAISISIEYQLFGTRITHTHTKQQVRIMLVMGRNFKWIIRFICQLGIDFKVTPTMRAMRARKKKCLLILFIKSINVCAQRSVLSQSTTTTTTEEKKSVNKYTHEMCVAKIFACNKKMLHLPHRAACCQIIITNRKQSGRKKIVTHERWTKKK